ncbi:MAG TPA: hypothetical protein VE978_11295 [Chitinophagales bacterium]|nr:hypothetical protein [Chitinophagales bacterium]
MKRVFSIALLFAFIFSTVGVIASSYSCCGMKMNSEIKMKSCCSMMNKNCCEKKEVKLLKVKDDFISNAFVKIDRHISLFTEIPVLFTMSYSEANSSSVNFLRDHSPPGRSYDLLSFIRIFRI